MADDWLITCATCATKYRGRPDMIGRTLQCKCGASFEVAPPQFTEDDMPARPAPLPLPSNDPDQAVAPSLEDLAPLSEPERAAMASPSPPPTRVSPVMEALIKREDDTGMPVFRERILPYTFLSIGIASQLILWFVWIIGPGNALAVMGIAVAVQLILFLPIFLFLIVSTAKWLDLDLGTFFSLIFKVGALTLGPLGVADAFLTIALVVSDFNWHVIAAGFGFYVILAGLPIWILFRTNVGETAILLTINYLPRTIAVYIAATVLNDLGIIR